MDRLLSRRNALVGGSAAGLSLALGRTGRAEPTATARGTVFDDAHGTGERRADGRGIAGVMVSNGEQVSLTDVDGRWSLPVADGDSIFVVKPSGWMTPLEPSTNLPQFYYHHAPQGTPESLNLRYPGLAPSGPLPDSIDFPLQRASEPSAFDVLLFTDPQPESPAELDFVRDDVVAQAAAVPAAFGITLGDIMFDDLSLYGRHNRIVGTIGVPWYNCCGNHDMNFDVPDNTYSRETYRRHFGPRYYAFHHGPATFFMLDNVVYEGADAARPNGAGVYHGAMGARQLAFVRNVLAQIPRERLVIFCMHIPLSTNLGPHDPRQTTIDRRAFFQAIAHRPATASFSGHTHSNEHHYFNGEDGFAGPAPHHHQVLTAVSGSWWSGPFDERGIPVALAYDGTPNGFHVLSVDGDRCNVRLVTAHDPNRAQMRVMLGGPFHRGPEVLDEYRTGVLLGSPIPHAAVASTELLVNLFNGGPNSTVAHTIGSGEPRAMKRVARPDPFVEEVYARNAATKKPWVTPKNSSHLWQARLPVGLPAGTHRIELQARDDYGAIHRQVFVLEVQG
jgi:hypothetical protein